MIVPSRYGRSMLSLKKISFIRLQQMRGFFLLVIGAQPESVLSNNSLEPNEDIFESHLGYGRMDRNLTLNQ